MPHFQYFRVFQNKDTSVFNVTGDFSGIPQKNAHGHVNSGHNYIFYVQLNISQNWAFSLIKKTQ